MIDYFTFRPKKLSGIEYWRLSNDCYDSKSWIWHKIKDKKYGLNFVGKNTLETKNQLKEILFNLKLISQNTTYVQRTFIDIDDKDVERCIWFKSEEDFKSAVNFLESKE